MAAWIGRWLTASFTGRGDAPFRHPPDTGWRRYGRWFWLTLAIAAAFGALAAGSAYVFASGYSDWAAVVVAGDWHAHNGAPSEVFDNARRDVAAALINIGFNPSNVAQFSERPRRYPKTHPLEADTETIAETLRDLAAQTNGGCLLYFSSHGAPSGLVLGDSILTPASLDATIDRDCGARPTIVVISACYSGVFVPALRGPNRVILTSARADRTSFGCGALNEYPYFDACFLSSIRHTHNFRALAIRAKRCVSRMERRTHMTPPSDPQIFIGRKIASRLPAWR